MKKLSRGSKSFSNVLRVNGTELPYGIEWRHVKYPRLEFKTEKLLVVLPKGVVDETPLLEKKIGWITRKHAEIQQAINNIKTRMKSTNGLLIFGDFLKFKRMDL